MISVTLEFRGHENEVRGVEPGTDRSSSESVSFASDLYQSAGSDTCWKAVVDRFDGLLLVFHVSGGADVTYHIRHALAGYAGTGTIATATILEIFGFGRYDQLFVQISQGGSSAHFIFVK